LGGRRRTCPPNGVVEVLGPERRLDAINIDLQSLTADR
jgi:hypothetical protein